ncbi:unnamed protein product [Owenia fusiformis]|uniref:Uncharacterized protein n=1 Tax=Owenia fusiformis TaxID=6347 RepID=A0A8S4PGR7_OWEFU|nr:unnamed protein product [Owenia fusiformis]
MSSLVPSYEGSSDEEGVDKIRSTLEEDKEKWTQKEKTNVEIKNKSQQTTCRSRPRSNFFGLNDCSSGSDDESNNVCNEMNTCVKDGSVPESEFWLSDNPKHFDTGGWKDHRIDQSPSEIVNDISIINASQTKYAKMSENISTLSKVTHSNITKSKHLYKSFGSYKSQNISHSMKNDVKKKSFYFVHHKIGPHLHGHSDYKLPKKQQYCFDGHTGTINRICWNKGQFSHLLASASMDGCVKIWNAFSSTQNYCVQTLTSHNKAVKEAVWNQDGRKVLSCGYDTTAKLHDVETGKQLMSVNHDSCVSTIKQHPVNTNCFVTGSNNHIHMWDTRSPGELSQIYTYKDKFGQVQDLLFINHAEQLVSCNDMVSRNMSDRNIMCWDVKTGVVLSNQVYQEKYTCTRLRLQPDGARFTAQSSGGYVALFSTTRPYKMTRHKRYEGHKVLGYNIGHDISPDGSLLVSGSSTGKMHLYDYNSSKLLKTFSSGSDVCLDVTFHPVLHSTIATCDWNGNISIWQ